MDKFKMVSTHDFRLSYKHSPSSDEEKKELQIDSLMYAGISTQPNIAYAMSVVSKFLNNRIREYWNVMKWILQYLKDIPKLSLFLFLILY